MLQNNDKLLAGLINKESLRQNTEIELIASENYVSLDVLEANGSILTNKYAEGYPGKRYYGWCRVIDEIETLAIERAKQLFGAEYVNVQPLSWSSANMAVYMGLLKLWDRILWLSLDQWWHLSHGHPINFSGILYEIIPYFLDRRTETINMNEVERLALEYKPKMILAWFSAYSRNLDWKRFRKIADKVWAILFADISHIAWLIVWWVLENPIPYCDIVTTTTHKTLRWPRWGIIMSKKKYSKYIARSVFPWIQGWPHENLIAWKAVAFWEALKPEFKKYCEQVVKNAQTLWNKLAKTWFKIISGWTDNHLLLIDVYSNFWVTGKDAEKSLEKVWLSTNKNIIPYDKRPPMNPSWIRVGTPAATTRGMKEKEMLEIVDIFTETIKNYNKEGKLSVLRNRVLDLCKRFPIYK